MSVSSDRADFTALYTQHLDFVWRNLRALGVSVAELDDATQDTFVVAYRRRADFDPEASMRGWLYGIARRVAWRQRRGGGRRQALEDAVAAQPVPTRSLEDDADEREALRLVQRFLGGLPEAQREVYWLAELEGMTAAQVGAAMGISPNTVGSRLRTARAAFARYTEVLRAREEGAAERLVRASRRQANPSDAQRRRVASALGLQLGAPSVVAASTASAGAFAGAKFWVLSSAAAVAVGALAVGAGRAAAPEAPARVASGTPSVAAVSDPPVAAVAPQVSGVGAPVAAAPTPSTPMPPPVDKATVRSAAPARRAQSAKPSEDAISAEAELLRSMRRKLSTDPKTTLRLASDHARRFPDGVLKLEAAALRVQSLCALDREAEAKSAAEDLGQAHPWASVAVHGCAAPGA